MSKKALFGYCGDYVFWGIYSFGDCSDCQDLEVIYSKRALAGIVYEKVRRQSKQFHVNAYRISNAWILRFGDILFFAPVDEHESRRLFGKSGTDYVEFRAFRSIS